MDITSNTTNTTTKPLSFTNGGGAGAGVLKRSNSQPNVPILINYKECLKNHAATLGGHALDGCGEFMASPSATPSDPTSLKCAACGCHRNFHRRDPDDTTLSLTPRNAVVEYQPHHRHRLPPPSHSPNSLSPPPISSSYPPSAPHMLLALSDGLLGPQNTPIAQIRSHPTGRKRFRTKFTQLQKEKMSEFAERVGWKIQKRDEREIADFCTEIGVERCVLKVWMHNNKSTLGKRDNNISNGNNVNLTNNNINNVGEGEDQKIQLINGNVSSSSS